MMHFGMASTRPAYKPNTQRLEDGISKAMVRSIAQFHLNFEIDARTWKRTTNQRASLGRRVDRIKRIAHIAVDDITLAAMTDTGTAGPAHRDIAGFRQFK